MADYAMKQDGGQKMAESLQQALQQLDMSKMGDVSQEAAQALKESMNLSEQELKQLAQSVRDMKKLEEAMKTIQQAQQANNQQPLDGEACSSCKSMSDYQKLYDKMMQQASGEGQQPSPSMSDAQNQSQGQNPGQGKPKPGSGNGSGMGGPGQGKGNIAPEDDSVVTNFQTEKDKSKLNAGKILLSWKTKGMAPKGEAVKDYQESLDTIRQDAAQALETEQIPAGDHDVIKKYFDTIEQANDAPEQPSQSK
jgi:predicted nucleic acid-binding protein